MSTVYVFPANGQAVQEYRESLYQVHPDGDLSIHHEDATGNPYVVWSRGMWQHAERKDDPQDECGAPCPVTDLGIGTCQRNPGHGGEHGRAGVFW